MIVFLVFCTVVIRFYCSRVLVAFSLIEPLVFQRMYLRGLDQVSSGSFGDFQINRTRSI